MEILKQLQLVDVNYEEKQAKLIFLDAEKGEIREVKMNKQAFDNATKKYIDDEAKAQYIEELAQRNFNLPFDRLAEAIGERRDIYAYSTYNSLEESTRISKFTEDYLGQIMEITVKDVTDNGNAVLILFDYEGETYASRMSYSKQVNGMNQYFVDPIKKAKQYQAFEEKFGIHIDNKTDLVGQKVMIEIKKAFGNVYAEAKPFPKKKLK